MIARKEYVRARTVLRLELVQTANATSNWVNAVVRSVFHGVARGARLTSVTFAFLSAAALLADEKLQQKRMIERPWLVTPLEEVSGD